MKYQRSRNLGTWILAVLITVGLVGCSSNNMFQYGLSDLIGVDDPAVPLDDGGVDPPPPPPPPVDPNSVRDTYLQDFSEYVDILWVIDDSGSMDEEQDNIRDNASVFTDRLLNANVDFQLGVITTDAGNDNKLVNQCSSILTTATAAEFAKCALVGTRGSGREEGLEAARRALDPDYVSGEMNPDLLRDGAPLHLVFVSDEEDETSTYMGEFPTALSIWNSLHPSLNVTEEMIDDLRDSMGERGNERGGRSADGREAYFPFVDSHLEFFDGLRAADGFTAHAITMTEITSTGCSVVNNSEEVSLRYPAFAEATGGSVSDVCDDWTDAIDKIGLQVSGLRKCFELSRPAIASSIEVYLNSIVVPEGMYEYRDDQNDVCFFSLPRVRVEVVIDYLTP